MVTVAWQQPRRKGLQRFINRACVAKRLRRNAMHELKRSIPRAPRLRILFIFPVFKWLGAATTYSHQRLRERNQRAEKLPVSGRRLPAQNLPDIVGQALADTKFLVVIESNQPPVAAQRHHLADMIHMISALR